MRAPSKQVAKSALPVVAEGRVGAAGGKCVRNACLMSVHQCKSMSLLCGSCNAAALIAYDVWGPDNQTCPSSVPTILGGTVLQAKLCCTLGNRCISFASTLGEPAEFDRSREIHSHLHIFVILGLNAAAEGTSMILRSCVLAY